MTGLADPQTIADLERRRDLLKSKCESFLLERRDRGEESLTGPDDIKFRSMVADLQFLEHQLSEQRRMGSLPPALARAAQAAATNQTTRSTLMTDYDGTYRPGGRTSYFRDVMRVSIAGLDDTNESRRRLAEHAEEVERRDLSRVDGAGGYAVPPAWLMSQYIGLPRAGRAFANLCQRQPLPGGTDSINIPKVITGTSTGIQTADNQPVSETDLVDTFINAPVRTIAGQQSLAIQLIDQSPIAFDEVIFNDLTADHDRELDRQVISGTGANGQVLGVLTTPNIGSVACTSVDIKGVYSAIANAIQKVHTTRFAAPDAIVMHPRRWGWLLSLLDLQNRPLFVPDANGPSNAAGTLTAVAPQDIVGRVAGLPVCVDANLPTNLSGGTEDPILVVRSSDLILWESGVRARALPEPKASTLTVLLQIYSYVAFSAARYPESVVQITGLTAPVFT
jgi:HK97 family phage major capsid protein